MQASHCLVTTNDEDPFDYGCSRCLDIGVRISPAGVFEKCPAVVLGQDHVEPSPSAVMIQRAITRPGVKPDSHLFNVARTLAKYSTKEPCSRFDLIDLHFGYVRGDEAQRRAVSAAIETLRDIWQLPVGSRKYKPFGYWIIVDKDDLEKFFREKLQQPLKEIGSVHRLARTHWPIFAEQIELEFSDLGDSDVG